MLLLPKLGLHKPLNYSQTAQKKRCQKGYNSRWQLKILSYFFSESRLEPMNITLQKYLHTYAEYRKKYSTASPYGLSSTYSEFSKFFYVCVWAWGLALEELQSSRYLHHNYSIPELQQKLSSKLMSVKFEGVSGVFNINASNVSKLSLRGISISQFCNGELNPRQFIRSIDNGCRLTRPATFLLPLKVVDYCFLCIAALQTLALIFLQVLTCIYRKAPTIKAADRIFLHISYTGSYILQIVTVLEVSAHAFSNFNFVTLFLGDLMGVWLLPIGMTFLISSITARSWRVYRLFNHAFHPGKFLTSNKFLFGLITTFIIVDICVAMVTSILIFYVHYGSSVHIAISNIILILFGVIVSIKAGTFVVLCVLTFLTEKVEKPLYSTRPYYFILVLNIMLIAVILYITLAFKTEHSVELSMQLEIVIYIFFVFLPPLLPILRHPLNGRLRKQSGASIESQKAFKNHLDAARHTQPRTASQARLLGQRSSSNSSGCHA